ncbi:MAG: protein phosphatase 2C domain-containing protein [Kofleriaceae bacterium]
MNTKSSMRGAAAAVSGARHVRLGRNGQDAAAMWIGGAVGAGSAAVGHIGAVVVCDGCGSGASSEVGARLGAQLVLAAIVRRLGAVLLDPASPEPLDVASIDRESLDGAFWGLVRSDVVRALDVIVRSMTDARSPSVPAWVAREQIVHDHFLFTTIAAVMIDDVIAVWAIGDGAYAIDAGVRELGPFENNQPPYLGYDLLADAAHLDARRVDPQRIDPQRIDPQIGPQRDSEAPDACHARARIEVTRGSSVIVATDGVAEIGLDRFAGVDRFVAHPDALRRHLALLARTDERIDWDARRVMREPALLQDDGAVAMLVRDARHGGAS